MEGRLRNKLCWCGSGVKYKKCHRDRASQEAPTLWDARAHLQKLATVKTCLHPLAGPTACVAPIIRAHTVRRAADLSAIARGGHVYQVSSDLADIDRAGGALTVKRVGINEASTFLGFCSRHDNVTFAPLEKIDLLPTDEQAFLLAYRSLCRELYLKERQLESIGMARQADKGRSVVDQLLHQEFVTLMRVGVETGLDDLRRHKAAFDDDLLSGNFGNIRYVAIHLDRTPDLMCSGSVHPVHTFDGRMVQDLGELSTQAQVMTFSLAKTPRGGVAVFSWRVDSDAASSAVVDSLLALPKDEVPEALVRYAVSHFENTYFRPDWWDALPPSAKEALLGRLMLNLRPESEAYPGPLADDGERTVAWQVTHVEQKRA